MADGCFRRFWLIGLGALGWGCEPAPPDRMAPVRETASPTATSTPEAGAVKPNPSGNRAVRPVITTENNPTTSGGRGAPSLEDQVRPAAWIYVDGLAGTFREQDGVKLLQWFIDGPVSASPTFRVEAFEPLLGVPKDFQCVIQAEHTEDGSVINYALRAEEGKFEVGREYDLLSPGSEFRLLDRMTGEVVDHFPPFAPGRYGIVAGIKNAQTGAEALAVTYFNVGR